jgi:chemotaxis protein methyltransferase CheR
VSNISFSDREFKRISEIMYQAAGLSFNDSKKSLIQSRLLPRIQRIGAGSFANYIAMLEDESQAAEFQMAVDLLTTNETYFFREPKHYELLEQELASRKSRAPLAVWSAASSFGDEAYSTAMLLADMQMQGRIGPDWSILATDISHRVLLSAKEAVYPRTGCVPSARSGCAATACVAMVILRARCCCRTRFASGCSLGASTCASRSTASAPLM